MNFREKLIFYWWFFVLQVGLTENLFIQNVMEIRGRFCCQNWLVWLISVLFSSLLTTNIVTGNQWQEVPSMPRGKFQYKKKPLKKSVFCMHIEKSVNESRKVKPSVLPWTLNPLTNGGNFLYRIVIFKDFSATLWRNSSLPTRRLFKLHYGRREVFWNMASRFSVQRTFIKCC